MKFCQMITTILLVLPGCDEADIGSFEDLGFSSWSQLEDELQPETREALGPNETVYDRILDTDIAQTVHHNGTRELWLSMCDSDESLVSILGYRCIAEKSPHDAFQAALTVLARRGRASLTLFVEPLKLIHEASPTEANKNAFTIFVNNPKNAALKLDDLTIYLDEKFLAEWAVSTDLSSVPGKVQYLAVAAVYAKLQQDGFPIPDRIAAVFETFEDQSGDRLATFVWYAPSTVEDARMKAAIERLLKDDTVSTNIYQLALLQRIEFIKKHVDVKALKLNSDQEHRYERFWQSVAKRKKGDGRGN